jgi:hypothetical protein
MKSRGAFIWCQVRIIYALIGIIIIFYCLTACYYTALLNSINMSLSYNKKAHSFPVSFIALVGKYFNIIPETILKTLFFAALTAKINLLFIFY